MTRLALKPAALIFDLDGTLLDTEPLYSIATQRVLDPYGKTFTLDIKRRIMGGDARTGARITIDALDLPMTAEAFLSARAEHLLKLFPEAAEISGGPELLIRASRSGVPLGLATSSTDEICRLKIGHRPWTRLFDVIVCGDDDALERSKPHPDIFMLCAGRLEINPEHVVAFEDSRNGIEAAKAAGMYVVGVRSPYTTEEDLGAADLLIDDFSELQI